MEKKEKKTGMNDVKKMEGKGRRNDDEKKNHCIYSPAKQTTRIFLSLNSAINFLDNI